MIKNLNFNIFRATVLMAIFTTLHINAAAQSVAVADSTAVADQAAAVIESQDSIAALAVDYKQVADSITVDTTATIAAETAADSLAIGNEAVNLIADSLAINSDALSLGVGKGTFKPTLYDLPYSLLEHRPNYKKLLYNTAALYAAGVLALGVLELLPENATAWNKEEIRNIPAAKRWWEHVKAGPVVDKDSWIFNYVLHPYGGAAYYMSARTQGFNAFWSFVYCFGVSTVFWEYGIEAVNEIPSAQDLILTPVVGSILGEYFYKLKRHIVSNGYELFGSSLLGNIVVYIIDPVNEVLGHLYGNDVRRNASFGVAATPTGMQAALTITF